MSRKLAAERCNLVFYRGKYAVPIGRGRERRRISTGTSDLGHARVVAKKILSSLNAAPSDCVADLWRAYIDDRRADGKDTTRQANAWKRLEPHFGHVLGHDVTKEDCRRYAKARATMGASKGTARIELEFLRACLNLRYGRGNSHVWLPGLAKPRDRYLTKPELERLLCQVTTSHVRLFIVLAVTTGARMSAILELKWDQVDFNHRIINFNSSAREQSNKRRPEVPINDRAFASLEEAAQGALTGNVIEWDGQSIKSIKKAIAAAAKRSGVPCSPHVFRHTAGVWMAEADIPMQKISQFLGHTTTRVTERAYARYSPSFMKDAAAALEF